MTDTRDKLNEAIFCLKLMRNTLSSSYATLEQGRDEFRYALNLFLSSARSVTWIMKSEFDKVPGFDSWYADKEAKMRSDSTMKFLLEQRNISLKQKPVQPHGNTKITISEHLTVSDSWVVIEHYPDGTQKKFESQSEPPLPPKPTEVTTEQSWYFSELPEGNNEVVAVCEAHISKLEQLVNECESKFASRLE
jgi:hypothetical protein